MPENPRRHDVLPLDAIRPSLLGSSFVAARLRIDPTSGLACPFPFTSTVQLAEDAGRLIEEHLLFGDCFGRGNVVGASAFA